jgi:hypothetical protein
LWNGDGHPGGRADGLGFFVKKIMTGIASAYWCTKEKKTEGVEEAKLDPDTQSLRVCSSKDGAVLW